MPSTNIPWPKIFDLGFWQTSKQIYRKLQYREKVFGEFQALPRFPRKMVLRHFLRKVVMYLLRKFCIFKHCTIIELFRRFDLRFWNNLKQIYRKFQYEGKCSRFCLVFRKMALYLLTKLFIFEPCTNTRSLLRLVLGFEQFRGNSNMGRKVLQLFQGEPRFPRKMVLHLLT